MQNLYIGLMSGTSMDAVDAVLVDFSPAFPRLVAAHAFPVSKPIKTTLSALCQPAGNEIHRMGEADIAVGELFAQAVLALLDKAGVAVDQVKAIGSHGQTVRHCPDANYPFTLQIGDPNVIVARTDICVVADFRRKDVALGGQGAPLTPAFHAAVFRDQKTDRVVLNIGGIANMTYLPAGSENVLGFDTGPGNTLLDAWCYQHYQRAFDENGEWAAGGKVIGRLLRALLDDAYFAKPFPKSTGREYFNGDWLARHLQASDQPQDVQATLLELTVQSIVRAINSAAPLAKEVLVCGGGAHNAFLMARLAQCSDEMPIKVTTDYGVHVDWVEAIAFAWLAKQTLARKPGNLPKVTGAKKGAILGAIYL